jgi:uncharacterized repeat protein (TIGR01451 family)
MRTNIDCLKERRETRAARIVVISSDGDSGRALRRMLFVALTVVAGLMTGCAGEQAPNDSVAGNSISGDEGTIPAGATQPPPPNKANLRLEKSAPDTAQLCGPLPYTITVSNNGCGCATAKVPTVTDELPLGVEFKGASTTAGSCSFAAGVVTCELPDLESGKSVTIHIDTTVVAPGTISNTASVESSTPDKDLSDDTDTATTVVSSPPLADWQSITSNFNGTPIPANATVWFTAVMKVKGLSGAPATVSAFGGDTTFSANGAKYDVKVPGATVTFDPAVSFATTTFDTAKNRWETVAPTTFSGNVFLTAVALPSGMGLPGGSILSPGACPSPPIRRA